MNLQACLHGIFDEKATPAPSGTEVMGELPRLVVMGDIGQLDLKEAAARLKWGLDLVSSFVAREERNEVTVIDERLSFSRLLAKEAGDRGWAVNYLGELIGHEADNIVVVGPGTAEAVSRARLCVAILLCWEDDNEMRFHYSLAVARFHEAIEQGLVEVAIPPWHPKVKSIFNIHHL